MVADAHAGHVVADRLDNAGALVAEHDRPVGREASDTIDDMQIAVADPGRDGAHQHLAAQRLVDIDRFDRQRRVRLAENGGFYLHRNLLGRSEDLPKENWRQAGPVPRERKARYAFRIGWVQE